MKLGLCTTTPEVTGTVPVALLAGTFAERLDRAAALGYDGVELMAVRPAELDAGAIRSGLRQRGLEAAAVASGALAGAEKLALLAPQEVSQRACARLHELIDFAAAAGAPVVTIGSFRGRLASAGWTADPAGLLSEILAAAADRAAGRGLRLALEPLNRYETDFLYTAAEALAFTEAVGQDALGLLLDTYHMNIEEVTAGAAIRQAAEARRLYHVHLGDSNRLPPGQGHVDFEEVAAALREVNYSGYLSAELLPLPDPDRAAELTIRHIRQFVPRP